MSPSLLKPSNTLKPAEALELAARAPEILRSNPKTFSASPLSNLFSKAETAELWKTYENLMMACLRVGNDKDAKECLQRLVNRFGETDERVMALSGLSKEAMATSDDELKAILDEYEEILRQNGANIPIHKRKVALLHSMGRTADSVAALNALLEYNATDPESWAELADMYLSQGLYQQAIFALEEVLVLMPNMWNVHARLGEVCFMAASQASEGTAQMHLSESLKRYCRSIELCDDYLRGYYGLKMVTDELLGGEAKSTRHQADKDGLALPEQATLEKLNEAATLKLGEIVRRYSAGEQSWQGYDAQEIAAARELLAKSSSEVAR